MKKKELTLYHALFFSKFEKHHQKPNKNNEYQ